MTTKQHIACNVYKFPLGECTLGGVTSKTDTVILQWGDVGAEDVEEDRYPVLQLKEGQDGYLYAEPVNPKKEGIMMSGGNYIHSSDSRFPARYPIPVHDRIETQAEYQMYSA